MSDISNKLDGCFNDSADKVICINKTWSDTNMDDEFEDNEVFERLECRNCKGTNFKILSIGGYRTAGKCVDCGMYYLVHCG